MSCRSSVYHSRSTAFLIGLVLFGLGVRLGNSLERLPWSPVHTITGSGGVLTNPETEADLDQFWETWHVLLDTYIDPSEMETQKLLQGAVEGLVRGVGDPYTVFLTKKETQEFDDSLNGRLEGIGAELQEKEGIIIVTKPLKDSPAERGGLKPGDIILKVDGELVEGWTLSEVVSHVRGPHDTKVTLSILRKGNTQPIDLTFTRAEIRIPSLETSTQKTASGTVGVLALHQFGETSINEVETALKEFTKAKVNGVILDLRGDGGGYLDGAVGLTSLFLKEGVVVTVERRGGGKDVLRVTGNPLVPDLPLVVLIDGGSASASEIVAGALQDHKRATIVGEKSFGKGTVQEIYPLTSGDAVKVTIARWITPNGKNLGKESIVPDVTVAPSAVPAVTVDMQLKRAIDVLFRPVPGVR